MDIMLEVYKALSDIGLYISIFIFFMIFGYLMHIVSEYTTTKIEKWCDRPRSKKVQR